MKKRTISKLKSIFGSKKGKRQAQQEQISKSSRSPSPEPAGAVSPTNGDSFRPINRTPPPSRAGPPPSPPVPTHPVAPVAPEPSGPLPLLPCMVCGRTFVPQSLAKHIKICEKMTVKKRKTFDSSRQRREGTDLEQYLPKNFGLPENSPFLEKSPPPTAKPTPKPKPQTVRSTITKPMAELQRCPHCQRAFGVRAFERHVEWCADKAKILPAAPAQPPPHIADAKQRLNARTQYKAPLARGRRSSQTRDKSSNSRSASVESSRAVSPPAPREYGDYRRGRTRASESGSSNDCPEDTSPHVPVIRNSRNSQSNSSGDANVKARQARLAKDLSSSRTPQDPCMSSVQQSHTDPNIKKNVAQNKLKNKLNAKKQQQLKKLEEIASKYSETKQAKTDARTSLKKLSDKSLIPVSKNARDSKADKDFSESSRKPKTLLTGQSSKRKSHTSENLPDLPSGRKCKPDPNKTKVKKTKIKKENSMSQDSLERTPHLNKDQICQTVGINTELLCIPCKIHDNMDPKKSSRKENHDNNDNHRSAEKKSNIFEPKIELLYKNPTLEGGGRDKNAFEKEKLSITYCSNLIITPSSSSNFACESLESVANLETTEFKSDDRNNSDKNIGNNSFETHESCADQKSDDDINNLSAENFEDNCEHDLSADDNDTKMDDGNVNDENDLGGRHGSGETYTKFTENSADLEEFLAITDELMSNLPRGHANNVKDEDVDNLHTPATNSIESINNTSPDLVSTGPPKRAFSDTFEELKSNLKELLKGAKAKDVIKKGDEILNKSEEAAKISIETSRNISDMEHITVYGLKFYENGPIADEVKSNSPKELKLPSIKQTNKANIIDCNKKRMQKIYKTNRKVKMLGEQARANKEYQTFIVNQNINDHSDDQSISSDAPPLKLPRIENKRLDDNYDPFISAARQMKELMSSETNIPVKIQNNTKDTEKSRTLPVLQPAKDKSISSYIRSDNTKMMKDTLNKTYQKTPTLQRMKSFGSTNNDNGRNTFGGRCSSFRLNRNEKKPTPKLNTTYTKSSKENISTADKGYFNRNSNLNRSFSSYSTSCYSTPKPKDKIPKIANSMYHSFQRSTAKQPVKLDKINRDNEKKDFVNLDAILTDDNSSMTDSNYIDPRLINENDNLPINVNTILNNPDIISSMESLLTTENLPKKFESFNLVNQNNNNNGANNNTELHINNDRIEHNNNLKNKITAPIIDDLSIEYDKIMHSLEQSIASKTSVRDDDSLCEDFDLEEFMTTFDEEIHKHKSENKRTCSSTTRIVKHSVIADSNKSSQFNSVSSTPKILNGMLPVNKSMSLNFSSNNVVSENLFPSSVKRSTSLLDSIHKKNAQKTDTVKGRQKSDQLEQDIMQSLKDFDKLYESEKADKHSIKEASSHNGTSKRVTRLRSESKPKMNGVISNGNHTPNGKTSNDSAYSSLNRISPSKLSLCTPKETNGLASLEQIPGGSDSSSHKDDARSLSSEEFLAMERSAELEQPLPRLDNHHHKEPETHANDKAASSRASSVRSHAGASGSWGVRRGSLSSSGSEASLPRVTAQRRSRFCHECGYKFPVDTANFCIECGVRRLVV